LTLTEASPGWRLGEYSPDGGNFGAPRYLKALGFLALQIVQFGEFTTHFRFSPL